MAELFLGQIPEAIYFALFMIYAKNLKEKRLLFILLMVAEYILLKQFLHFTIWFQILYTTMTYVLLKVLYKNKAQITDVFTFTIASIILMIVSASYFFIIGRLVKNFYLAMTINRLALFIFVFALNDRLYKIQNLYKKLWNRNDKVEKKIKSTTFRCINLVISILFTIYAAFIMTGKSNIKDMYLWNNNNEPSKYQDIVEYIKYNEFDDTLIEFENKLKEKNLDYLIYKYRFKDHKTFAEISDLLEMETPRIAEHLNKIAFAIRIYCKI